MTYLGKRRREEIENFINSACSFGGAGTRVSYGNFLVIKQQRLDPFDSHLDQELSFFTSSLKNNELHLGSSVEYNVPDVDDIFNGLTELVPLEDSGLRLNTLLKKESLSNLLKEINVTPKMMTPTDVPKTVQDPPLDLKSFNSMMKIPLMDNGHKKPRKTWPLWRTNLFMNAADQLMEKDGLSLEQLKPLKIRDVMLSMTEDPDKQKELKSLDSRTIGIKLQKFRDRKKKESVVNTPFIGFRLARR